jgi:hypothetical protein
MSWNMRDQSAARSLHSSQGVETARRDLCRELKGSAAGTGLLREVNEGTDAGVVNDTRAGVTGRQRDFNGSC